MCSKARLLSIPRKQIFLGLKKNDKILKINSKPPKNVNDAVSFIKKVGLTS